MDERQYEDVCRRLVNAKNQIIGFKDWLSDMKTQRPTMVTINTITLTYSR